MYLQHYGVKGQEWGVQNGPPYPLSDSARRRMVRAQRKRDYANRELMSDEELDARLKRLRMEKEYRALNNEMVESGKSMLQRTLKSAGENTLTKAVQGVFALAVGRGITAITGSKDIGSAIASGSYKDSEVAANPGKSAAQDHEKKKNGGK